MTQLCLRIVFLSLMALSSSVCQAGEGDPALPDGVQAPDYGAVEPLRGQYLWGEESADFYPCEKPRSECLAIPRRNRQACWVRFAEEPRARLSEVDAQNSGPQGGELWIEGIGRTATKPGSFGHLGAYHCQIEIMRIDRIEAGPPHMFDFGR